MSSYRKHFYFSFLIIFFIHFFSENIFAYSYCKTGSSCAPIDNFHWTLSECTKHGGSVTSSCKGNSKIKTCQETSAPACPNGSVTDSRWVNVNSTQGGCGGAGYQFHISNCAGGRYCYACSSLNGRASNNSTADCNSKTLANLCATSSNTAVISCDKNQVETISATCPGLNGGVPSVVREKIGWCYKNGSCNYPVTQSQCGSHNIIYSTEFACNKSNNIVSDSNGECCCDNGSCTGLTKDQCKGVRYWTKSSLCIKPANCPNGYGYNNQQAAAVDDKGCYYSLSESNGCYKRMYAINTARTSCASSGYWSSYSAAATDNNTNFYSVAAVTVNNSCGAGSITCYKRVAETGYCYSSSSSSRTVVCKRESRALCASSGGSWFPNDSTCGGAIGFCSSTDGNCFKTNESQCLSLGYAFSSTSCQENSSSRKGFCANPKTAYSEDHHSSCFATTADKCGSGMAFFDSYEECYKAIGNINNVNRGWFYWNGSECLSEFDVPEHCPGKNCFYLDSSCGNKVLVYNLDIGESCSKDSNCSSNYCSGGFCVAKNSVNNGGHCNSDEVCKSHFCDMEVCSKKKSVPIGGQCDKDEACKVGFCYEHVCVRYGSLDVPQPCQNDKQCKSGICFGSAHCAYVASKKEGETCDRSDLCQKGLTCQLGKCIQENSLEYDEPCTDSDGCSNDYICNSTCVQKKSVTRYGYCTSDKACSSGKCCNNKCLQREDDGYCGL